MKTSQKKATGQHSALEVRLNRAMEETDKYKSALQKARNDLKVGTGSCYNTIQELVLCRVLPSLN